MAHRSVCFTIFEPHWQHNVLSDLRIKCAAVQKERCPDTNREHFQGFLILTKPARLGSIKDLLKCPSAHIEKTKGTPIQAWDYCTKDDTRIDGPWTYGDKPKGQGSRTDISSAIDILRDGKGLREVLDSVPEVLVKYHAGLKLAQSLLAKRRCPETAPIITIYWGESGTGKSKKATEENKDAYILTKPNGNTCVWFDGYEGQDTILFDEFYGWIQYDLLLRILDRYPLKLQIKGGFVECSATKFIFTSNKPWTDWYPNIDDKSALERRIKEFGKITHFAKL